MQIIRFSAHNASVTGYLQEDHDRLAAHKIRPALVICPGGGYGHLSPREADPPALEFLAMGYQVFILSYSLRENAGNLRPLRELAEAVNTVRTNADRWHIDPEKIAVMGFSAGAHLAGSLSALWNRPELNLPEGCRPNALILSYPVVTMGEFTHPGSRDAVTGGDDELKALLSLENQVSPAFPPTFLWHTADDACVPVENTFLLASALRRAGVPFECHIFAHGPHGLATCSQETETRNPECAQWLPLCKTWLNTQFRYVP